MKFALIGINSSYFQSSYSIYAIAASYGGEDVMQLKEYHINQHYERILSDLYDTNADVYMFSCYLWNIEFVLHLCKNLKQLKNCTIVLGGSEVGYTPEKYFQKTNVIDYIVSGEGESVVNELVHCLSNNINPSFHSQIYTSEKEYDAKSTESEWLTYRKFPYNAKRLAELNGKILYYETSRGCPFACSYCISQLDRSVRSLPIDIIEQELLFFMQNHVKQVKLIDRTFNYDDKRARHIIRFILEHNICTNFHLEICADILSDELITLLTCAPVGYFQIEVGVQTTNQETLAVIGRKNDLSKISSSLIRIIESKNIHVHADLIAMLPKETMKSFQSGFNYLYDIKPHMIQIGFLKVLNGTIMYYNSQNYNIIFDIHPPYETLSTDSITFREKVFIKELSHIIDKYYNSRITMQTLDYLIDSSFPSAFDFYSRFVTYHKENSLFDRSLSRDDCYHTLMSFSKHPEKTILDSLIAYDYLLNNPLHLPSFLQEKVTVLYPKAFLSFLGNEQFIRCYLPSFEGKMEKEIIKHIFVVVFHDNPIDRIENQRTIILFYDEKEKDVFAQNKHIILPYDRYYSLIE